MHKFLFLILLCMTACSNMAQHPAKPSAEACPACKKCSNACADNELAAPYDVPQGANAVPAPETLLDYIGRFSAFTAEEQKKELAQIHENLSLNKFDFSYRMKAAIIYALPASRLREVNKAQAFLDSLMREKALDTQRKALVNLLRDYINDNAKLGQENSKLLQENIALMQKSRDDQKRAETLQQTLDDLKAIEKSMADREQGLRK